MTINIPPPYPDNGIEYVTRVGSHAYGVATPESDEDFYGFVIPPAPVIFPHLKGEIMGFGRQQQRFEQAQGKDPYDYTLYNIVKFFNLCMDNNPNMIDALFTPDHCVIILTEIGKYVRDNRNHFLHKGSYHRFKGYAYAQMNKLENKVAHENPRRSASIEKFGYDTKYAYHLIRLMLEGCEILKHGTLTLDANPELLMSIRNGEFEFADIERTFATCMTRLDDLYTTSTLRHEPDQRVIKQILVDCLEMKYGNLSKIGFKNETN